MSDAMPTVAIIGPGRVGSLLGRGARRAGCAISAVYGRNSDTAAQLASELDARPARSLPDALAGAELVFLTVPDSAVEPVAQELAALNGDAAVVHTSGFHSIRALHAVESTRPVGVLHPALPIATRDAPADVLAGVVFAIESNHPRLTHWLYSLVGAWKGIAVALRPHEKALYHAALTTASNHTVVLFAVAQHLLERAGLDSQVARAALLPLLKGTLSNLELLPAAQALTGPLARGDLATVEGHLRALQDAEESWQLYASLVRAAVPLLAERGSDTSVVTVMLEQWEQQ